MPRPTGMMTIHIQRITQLLESRNKIAKSHDGMVEVVEAIDICIAEQRQFVRELLAQDAHADE